MEVTRQMIPSTTNGHASRSTESRESCQSANQEPCMVKLCPIPTCIQLHCSATMMDDTLTNLSLEPMKIVTQLNRKSLRALEEVGSPHCARNETVSLRCRSQCPSVCHTSTLSLGHMTTVQTFSATNFSPSSRHCHSRRRNQRHGHHDQTQFCTLPRTRWSCTV